jgi:hypothetical protein
MRMHPGGRAVENAGLYVPLLQRKSSTVSGAHDQLCLCELCLTLNSHRGGIKYGQLPFVRKQGWFACGSWAHYSATAKRKDPARIRDD